MATKLLISLILLSLLSLSTSLSSETMLQASEILKNSGFNSMALILEFGSQTLIPQSPSLTIFSPSDHAFALSGQPPLSLLHFHFSPQSLSLQTLKSLSSGTKIPTFLSNHSLIVTSSLSNHQISLNDVKIKGPPIYDNGSLVIFGIDKFLDPKFLVPGPTQSHSGNLGCVTSVNFEVMMILVTIASLFLTFSASFDF